MSATKQPDASNWWDDQRVERMHGCSQYLRAEEPMREHVAVRTWSERIEDEPDQNMGGVVVERAGLGWRHLTARREREASGSAPTSYVAHYIQCRCGEIFLSRHSATTRSLLRSHLARWLAESNARSGFDAAAARRDGENHGGLGGGM